MRTRLVRLVLSAIVLSLLTVRVEARSKFQTYIERGGLTALTSLSGTVAKVQRSCPGATVNVYLIDTTTPATIYRDSAGTPLGFSLTADIAGSIEFYGDESAYDLRISGGGCTTHTRRIGGQAGTDQLVVDVRTMGALCDNSTNDTVAIQAAIDVVGPHKVLLPNTVCVTTSQLLINQHGVVIEGQGMRMSGIRFAPTGNGQSAIKIQLGSATIISQVELRSFRIYSTDSTFAKTAIDIVDGSETLVQDMMIGPSESWTGGASISPHTGSGSVGIRLRGREFGSFHRNLVAADIPLRISANPNGSITLDHHVFDDESYFIADIGNPNVLIDDGDLRLTSITFKDMAWVGGSHGLYWNDTASVGTSSDLSIINVRPEQLENGAMIHIRKNALLQGLRVQDVSGGAGTNVDGIFVHNVSPVILDNYKYTGVDECINANITLDWRSSLCQSNTTKNLQTMIEVWSQGFSDSLSPMPVSGWWIIPHANFTAGQCYRFMGVYQCAATGTLSNGATTSIPSFSGGLTTGKVDITFHGATLNGAFSCSINATRTVRNWTSDSSIADCTGNVAGDITIHYVSSSSILLRNNLGESVTYNWQLLLN